MALLDVLVLWQAGSGVSRTNIVLDLNWTAAKSRGVVALFKISLVHKVRRDYVFLREVRLFAEAASI